MTPAGYAVAPTVIGIPRLHVWRTGVPRSLFGDIAITVFLLAQCLDGVFTYLGVMTFGIGVEANPVIATLMIKLGHGLALVGAKGVAGVLGMGLHLRRIHTAVALLAGLYLAAAILPWAALLFF